MWDDEEDEEAGEMEWTAPVATALSSTSSLPASTVSSSTADVTSSSTSFDWGGRVVASVDLDCFYAQCEEIRRPELKGLPIGVQQKHIVVTSNYTARKVRN